VQQALGSRRRLARRLICNDCCSLVFGFTHAEIRY